MNCLQIKKFTLGILIVFSAIGVCFYLVSSNIVKLTETIHGINYKIEKNISEKISLEVVEAQPVFGGASEKLLLKDQLGQTWLFKFGAQTAGSFQDEVSSFNFSRLFGIKTCRRYLKKLPINGKNTLGLISKFLPDVKTVDIYSDESWMFDWDYVARALIFDWLIGSRSRPAWLFDRKDRSLVTTDRDFIFDYQTADISAFFKERYSFSPAGYEGIEKYLISKFRRLDKERLLDFIYYVMAASDGYLEKIFYEEYLFNQQQHRLREFLKRKNNLAEDVRAWPLLKAGSLPAGGQPPKSRTIRFAFKVFKAEFIKFAENIATMLKLRPLPDVKQESIDIIFSYEAAMFISDIFDVDTVETAAKDEILAELNSLYSRAQSADEKIAIFLYMSLIEDKYEEFQKSGCDYESIHIPAVLREQLESNDYQFTYGEEGRIFVLSDRAKQEIHGLQ